MEAGSRRMLAVTGSAALAMLALGLLAMPDHLAGWDPIQFALGIERFDLTMHRPHPPGYLGHLGLGGLLTGLGLTPDRAILWASLLESVGTVLVLGLLGRRLGGPGVGMAASWLLATHPLMLQQAVSGEVYPAEALLATGLVLAGVSLDRTSGRLQIAAFCLLLGLAGGVRQSLPIFLGPFALWRLWAARGSTGRQAALRLGIALGSGALGIALWLVPLAALAGGIGSLSRAFGRQFFEVFGRAYSPLLGASPGAFHANLQGLWRFLVQVLSLGGALGLLLVPLAFVRRQPTSESSAFRTTALTWALPPLLWFSLLFIYKAGHALLLAPLAMLLAARVLQGTGPSRAPMRDWWVPGLTALVAVAQVGWFLSPPASWTRVTGDAGLPGIWYGDRETEAFTGLIRDLGKGDPERVLVVTRDGRFSFRRAMWHLPDTPVQWWMDRDSTGVPMPGVQVCEARHHEVRCVPGPGFWQDGPLPQRMEIPLAEGAQDVVWFVDPLGPMARVLDGLPGTARERVPGTPFECWRTRLSPGPLALEAGPYRLVRDLGTPDGGSPIGPPGGP